MVFGSGAIFLTMVSKKLCFRTTHGVVLDYILMYSGLAFSVSKKL